MKRIYLLLYLTCYVLIAQGTTFTISGITYETLTDTTVTVTGGAFSMTDLVIPATVSYKNVEYKVKEIGDKGLYGWKSGGSSGTYSKMASLVIPEGIERIGKQAIARNRSLKTVSLPSTLLSISDNAFNEDVALKNIDFPNGTIISSIGNGAFEECHTLTNFDIPSSVCSIGQNAFNGCKKLTYITIPQNVTNIQDNAFCNCTSLQSVVLHPNITRIEDYAFYGCQALEDINTEYFENLNYIGTRAFYGVSGIKHLVISNVDTIHIAAFAHCNNLEYLWVKEGVTVIENWAFGSCRNLIYIVLPSTLNKVGTGAFGESEVYLLDYENHDPRTFFLVSDEPFAIEYSKDTDGYNIYPSLGKIVDGDCFYVKESAVDAYKQKWGSYANKKVFYKIPFDSDLQYSTNYREFDADYSVTANSGNKPFVATGYRKDYVTFSSIDNNVVPAATGAVIRKTSDENTWYQIAESQGSTLDMTNYLRGVTYADTIPPTTNDGNVNMVLNYGIFFKFNNAGLIGAHKAYLQLPLSVSSQAKMCLWDSATGIEDNKIEMKLDDAIYNLNGIKVKNPSNGVYIINGKKLMIK